MSHMREMHRKESVETKQDGRRAIEAILGIDRAFRIVSEGLLYLPDVSHKRRKLFSFCMKHSQTDFALSVLLVPDQLRKFSLQL